MVYNNNVINGITAKTKRGDILPVPEVVVAAAIVETAELAFVVVLETFAEMEGRSEETLAAFDGRREERTAEEDGVGSMEENEGKGAE